MVNSDQKHEMGRHADSLKPDAARGIGKSVLVSGDIIPIFPTNLLFQKNEKMRTEPGFQGVACGKKLKYRNTSGSGLILHLPSAQKTTGDVVDELTVSGKAREIITGNPTLMVS